MPWNEQDPREDWRKEVICPIYKEGDKSKCNNYRGISLVSHAFDVYERILVKKKGLRNSIEPKLGEWQSVFPPG